MNDDELRDALHSVAPAAPDTASWAEAARRRSRGTRGVVAAVGLLAVAVIAGLAIGNLPSATVGVPVAPASTAPASGASATAVGSGCTNAVTGGEIPADALMLRLCPAGEDSFQQFPPLEALDSEGAHTVLAVLRKRPLLDKNGACRADLGPAFLLIAEYSGREPVVMNLQLYGCAEVGTTTDRRTGAEEVLAAFQAATSAQRARDPGNAIRVGSLCPPAAYVQRSAVMPVRLADATGGSICSYADTNSARVQVERVLDAEAFARITADLAAHTSPWTPPSCGTGRPDRPAVAVVLTTRWGDVLSIAHDECAGTYRYRDDSMDLRWRPSAGVAALLRQLVQ